MEFAVSYRMRLGADRARAGEAAKAGREASVPGHADSNTVNERWSMDIMSAWLVNGRWFQRLPMLVLTPASRWRWVADSHWRG